MDNRSWIISTALDEYSWKTPSFLRAFGCGLVMDIWVMQALLALLDAVPSGILIPHLEDSILSSSRA